MNRDESLIVPPTQKLDEGRKYINNFALAAVGSFAIIAISLMIVYKNIINESYGDLLSLLIGMVAVFCYGKFVLTSKKYWFILFIILMTGACAVFLELPGL